MSSYIIAGSSDKVDTAECENMANLIRQYYPEISFKIVLKDLTQWEQYADEICRIYGFKQKSNPIIYTMDGCLIGDRNVQPCKSSRHLLHWQRVDSVSLIPSQDKVPSLQMSIRKQPNKNWIKSQNCRGARRTLMEKIEQQMLIIYSNNIVQPTDGVFKQSFKSGVKEKLKTWYDSLNNLIRTDVKRNLSNDSDSSLLFQFLYKFDDRLRPIKKLQESHHFEENKEAIQESNYVDVEVKEDGKLVIKQILWFSETARFLTLEQEQLQQQLQELAQQREREQSHKNSMISPDIRRDTNELNDTNSSPKATIQTQPIVEQPNEEGELDVIKNDQVEDPQQTVPQDADQQQEQINPTIEQQELDQVQSIGGGPIVDLQEDIETILNSNQEKPDKIDVSELFVHKFRNEYALILHPFPLMDGQMLLCKPFDNHIDDYSCIKRGRINSYKKSSAQLNCEGLYEHQLDIFKAITIQDCEIVAKIINKCDALVVLNILPQDLESFLPLSNGHYSIILRQHAELNKANKKLFKFLNEKKVQVNYKQLMPIEEFILDQRSQCYEVQREIFKLKSLDIQHYFAFPPQLLTAESVMDIIMKILSIILDYDHTAALKMGFNLLISKHLVFLCPTFSNYDDIDGFKLHLQAFTAMGFLNLPTGSSSINFFDLLQKAQEKLQQ
ncbi:unnamed protein product (macronuclear) [Paramecium tetraurelia]|uniref:Uncharacterized protein n=1 Tax=Paramecium tetraurelia TaxID=5888 RepID=A0DJ27_PARTE|nr:uncharacterized protein GSPATT00017401001 [Paramecium tetraurelia]CAK83044.1 unnamed protein product [Paramecium tetraurelia]|eukprot:XP_001450441.1 hypothetical protein (macronuclear) [Paramecium tetraurelia strain d4-2]